MVGMVLGGGVLLVGFRVYPQTPDLAVILWAVGGLSIMNELRKHFGRVDSRDDGLRWW